MANETTRKITKITNNSSPGATITAECPIALTYHQIRGKLENGWTVADMDEIRIVGNGEILQRYPRCTSPALSGGQVLNAVNAFNGFEVHDDRFVIDFDRHNLLTRAAQQVTAFGTGLTAKVAAQMTAQAAANGVTVEVQQDPTPLTSMTLEIDIDPAAAATGLLGRLLAYQTGPSAIGLIKLLRTYIEQATASGEYDITSITKGDLINKIYIFGQAGATANVPFNRVRVEIDNYIAFDRTPEENTDTQNDYGVRFPQPNLFVIDPTEKGYGNDGYVTANISDFLVKLNMDEASNMMVLVEYIGGVAQ